MSPEMETQGGRVPGAGEVPDGPDAAARLAFLQSAYGTAQGAVRLADEKVGYILLFLGILVAILSLRGDGLFRILFGGTQILILRSLLAGSCLLFLGSAGIALVYAVRSRALAADPSTDVPGVLARLATPDTEDLMGELAQALQRTAGVAQRKWILLKRCLSWAAVALASWSVVLLLSLWS